MTCPCVHLFVSADSNFLFNYLNLTVDARSLLTYSAPESCTCQA